MPTGVERDEIRDQLEAVAGVERAFIEGPPWQVHLVCGEGVSDRAPLDAAIGVALSSAGVSASGVEVHLSYVGPPEPRRRVRFLSSELEHPRVGWALTRVGVEWNGIKAEGEVEGESNPTYDLRLSAVATVRALAELVPTAPRFHIVGVKPLRVFDRDLVVVLVRVEGSEEQPLVGSSLVIVDPARSASLAVLNALNRILGNYLSVSD